MIEGETQLEQQPSFEQTARDGLAAGCGTDGPQQDRVGLRQFGQHGVGKHLPGPLPAVRAQVVRRDRELRGRVDGLQHLQSFGHHLWADPVAADDGEVVGGLVRGCAHPRKHSPRRRFARRGLSG